LATSGSDPDPRRPRRSPEQPQYDRHGEGMGHEQTHAKAFSRAGRCARIGGDEFVIFLPELEAEQVAEMSQRIKNHLPRYRIPSTGHYLHLSLGWSWNNTHEVNIYELFKEADANMYRDKLANKLR